MSSQNFINKLTNLHDYKDPYLNSLCLSRDRAEDPNRRSEVMYSIEIHYKYVKPSDIPFAKFESKAMDSTPPSTNSELIGYFKEEIIPRLLLTPQIVLSSGEVVNLLEGETFDKTKEHLESILPSLRQDLDKFISKEFRESESYTRYRNLIETEGLSRDYCYSFFAFIGFTSDSPLVDFFDKDRKVFLPDLEALLDLEAAAVKVRSGCGLIVISHPKGSDTLRTTNLKKYLD